MTGQHPTLGRRRSSCRPDHSGRGANSASLKLPAFDQEAELPLYGPSPDADIAPDTFAPVRGDIQDASNKGVTETQSTVLSIDFQPTNLQESAFQRFFQQGCAVHRSPLRSNRCNADGPWDFPVLAERILDHQFPLRVQIALTHFQDQSSRCAAADFYTGIFGHLTFSSSRCSLSHGLCQRISQATETVAASRSWKFSLEAQVAPGC